MALDVESARFRELHPFFQLVEIMEALRAPDGCPWDREQTHQTLTRYLLEESYEAVEAIEKGELGELKGELGDLLLQVVFHAQLAREAGRFEVEDVCRHIVDKMIRRHPHVFAAAPPVVSDSGEVLRRWAEIKQAEKVASGASAGASRLDGLPTALPGLLLAERLQDRAAHAGFDFPDAAAAWEKLEEELGELRENPGQEELGDALFALVSLARKLGVDPEAAVRATCGKFRSRFAALEQRYGDQLGDQSPQSLVQAWHEVSG